MKTRATVLGALLCLVTFVVAQAQSLPAAKPEQVGLSSERLNRITARLKGDADKGVIPGAVVLVARHGNVALFEAAGVRNPETKAAMTKDAIFRIYSMSKPITSVAAMTLFEEGNLAEPVSKYIPELGGLKVGVEKPDASGKPTLELVPAQRDMTIHDLFRHTSGLTYGFFGSGRVAVRRHGRRAQLGRRRRDLLLGGSEGGPVRRLHDAVAQPACTLSLPAQGYGLRGSHQARKIKPAPLLDAARPH